VGTGGEPPGTARLGGRVPRRPRGRPGLRAHGRAGRRARRRTERVRTADERPRLLVTTQARPHRGRRNTAGARLPRRRHPRRSRRVVRRHKHWAPVTPAVTGAQPSLPVETASVTSVTPPSEAVTGPLRGLFLLWSRVVGGCAVTQHSERVGE